MTPKGTTMSTTTIHPEILKRRVDSLGRWVRSFDRWLAICAEARDGNMANYNPRRMPSKASKHYAYDDAYVIAQALGLPRAENVDDLRGIVAAGRVAVKAA